jgi:hypothetical protein
MASFQSLVVMSEGDKLKKVADMRARAEYLRNEILSANTESDDMQGKFHHRSKKVIKMFTHFK